MQRLVDRIWDEFAPKNCHYVEINVLDGNGDPFEVYYGELTELSAYNFSNILRDPCCFYFFTISSVIHNWESQNNDSSQIRKELCWLTDPLAPEIIDRNHNSFHVSWQPAKFCGIIPPQSMDSVVYTLEIAEGVEWKQNFATKYMTDLTATNYRKVCSGSSIFSARINDLKPSCWYHLRLVVEYLGLCVMSETRSINTQCSAPSVPGNPNMYVIPVPSSFDLVSDTPARLDVLLCWSPSASNGQPISKYQVQLCRIDVNGQYVQSEEARMRRKQRSNLLHSDTLLNSLTKGNLNANQWVKSPGKSVSQIQNSLSNRSKSAHSKRLPASASVLSPNSQMYNSTSFADFPAFSESQLEPSTGGVGKWTVVYENLNRTFKLAGPSKNETEWHVRVRAKNSLGWSAYSETLRVGSYTHPTLFRGVPAFSLVPPSSPTANARLSKSVDFSARKSMSPVMTNNLLLGVTEEEFMRAANPTGDRHNGTRTPISSQVRFDSAGNSVSGEEDDMSPFAPTFGKHPILDESPQQHQPFSSTNERRQYRPEALAPLPHYADHHSPDIQESDLNPHVRQPHRSNG